MPLTCYGHKMVWYSLLTLLYPIEHNFKSKRSQPGSFKEIKLIGSRYQTTIHICQFNRNQLCVNYPPFESPTIRLVTFLQIHQYKNPSQLKFMIEWNSIKQINFSWYAKDSDLKTTAIKNDSCNYWTTVINLHTNLPCSSKVQLYVLDFSNKLHRSYRNEKFKLKKNPNTT